MKKVITYGTFDLLHEGHRQILANAKKLGDYLIVGVTSDYFDVQRGKMNVEQSLVERIENVKRISCVDEILVEEYEGQKIADIRKHGVDVFAIGSDWKGKFDFLKEYCEVVYLDRTPNISSTSLRDGHYGIVRLGFAGAGSMAWRYIVEMKFVGGCQYRVVYDPSMASASAFAQRYNLELAYDDYDSFLKEVDAVYVSTEPGAHYDMVKRALESGKHVLCESPVALSAQETIELFDLAAKRNLVLMEAIRTAYAPAFNNLLAIAKNGRIGEIKDVEVAVTKLTYQESKGANSAGSFTELGSTTLMPIVKLLGRAYDDIRFTFFTDSHNVDLYTKAYFQYPCAIATSKTGIDVKSEGQLLISGAKGYILVKSPWWLTKTFEVCYEDPSENEHFSAPFLGYGTRYVLADFVRNIRMPDRSVYALSSKDSIALAGIMEKFLEAKRNHTGGIVCR